MIIGIFIITAILITILCYGFYWIGYHAAIKKAENIPDPAIKNAVVVVKQDDRIIECDGMMMPMQCEKCIFGRVNGDDVECFAPDYDGVPVFGVTKKCERYGHLVHMTDECKGGHNAQKQKEGKEA